jgi:MoxR-like ATPase
MHPALKLLHDNIKRVIVGKDDVIELAIVGVLARGHLLIEDPPGLGKTMLARSLAQSLHAIFRRIQFTPDLLPSDVTGVSVFHPTRQQFEFFPGPVFTNVLLADEINRTSPRTQSSLLEAMEERQVTVDGKSHPLPDPFMVIATQNPVELDGTYPLPEAQIDRFLLRLELGYPEAEEEISILAAQVREHPITHLRPVLELEELRRLQEQVREVRVAREVQAYIVALAAATRGLPEVRLGISPRGSLGLLHAAQAHAFLRGMSYVSPDSVKAVARHVLGHRLLLDPHREYTGLSRRSIVERILGETPVPVLPRPVAASAASTAHGQGAAEVQG